MANYSLQYIPPSWLKFRRVLVSLPVIAAAAQANDDDDGEVFIPRTAKRSTPGRGGRPPARQDGCRRPRSPSLGDAPWDPRPFHLLILLSRSEKVSTKALGLQSSIFRLLFSVFSLLFSILSLEVLHGGSGGGSLKAKVLRS